MSSFKIQWCQGHPLSLSDALAYLLIIVRTTDMSVLSPVVRDKRVHMHDNTAKEI